MNLKFCFGGTSPVAAVARKTGLFDYVSDGFDDIDDVVHFLRGLDKKDNTSYYPDNIIDRINNKYPYPVLRHHFGLPSLNETVLGVQKIAESKVLDVISIGPDQNTQQYFFRQDRMSKSFDGAGGVPLRTREDFLRLKRASRTGNYPLLRCYSGTANVFEMADMLKSTIDNAWSAIPICWYNELDGRGDRPIEKSIREAQKLIQYQAQKGIVVEINEPHHWALRDAHDVISVVMSYISAYNAKVYGVANYIAQYMFNAPNTLSFSMDLARVLAMMEMAESLKDDKFNLYRQVRAGLNFLSPDLDIAKGQLAATTMLAMNVKPHIIHVVGYCEAEHAATADNVIESCKIVRGVLKNTVNDNLDITHNENIINRKNYLIKEANYLIDFIKDYYSEYTDPLANSFVLADAIKRGIIDAPHILKNEKFRGILDTIVINGKNVAYSKEYKREINEEERISLLRKNNNLK